MSEIWESQTNEVKLDIDDLLHRLLLTNIPMLPGLKYLFADTTKDEIYADIGRWQVIHGPHRHDPYIEELIQVACHPRRILWYNDDPDHPLAKMTQEEINELCT